MWENHTNLNDIDSKCFLSLFFQSHNLHPQVMGFMHTFIYSTSYLFTWSMDWKTIPCSRNAHKPIPQLRDFHVQCRMCSAKRRNHLNSLPHYTTSHHLIMTSTSTSIDKPAVRSEQHRHKYITIHTMLGWCHSMYILMPVAAHSHLTIIHDPKHK